MSLRAHQNGAGAGPSGDRFGERGEVGASQSMDLRGLDRKALHPVVALDLLDDLTRALYRAIQGPQWLPETHQVLMAIAHRCIEAGKRVEDHLNGVRGFNWWQRHHWTDKDALRDVMQEQIDQAERRARVAEAEVRAYRQGRMDERAHPTEADCAFP